MRSPVCRIQSRLALALALSLSASLFVPKPAEAQSFWERLFGRQRPVTARSSGRADGGAIRDETCSAEALQGRVIKALVRADNYGTTTSDHPTFYFYMPFSADIVNVRAEFMLLDAERNYVLQQPIAVALPDEPGIVRLTLPPTTPPLAIGESYNWYFSVICDEWELSKNPGISGWVERVSPESMDEPSWHEAVDDTVSDRLERPAEWQSFLALFGLADLAEEPVEDLVIMGGL